MELLRLKLVCKGGGPGTELNINHQYDDYVDTSLVWLIGRKCKFV